MAEAYAAGDAIERPLDPCPCSDLITSQGYGQREIVRVLHGAGGEA